jgi:diguanylate cyclase (GGDEF)-like protein
MLRLLGSTAEGVGDEGGADEGAASNTALAARTQAASDACYRLLTLGARALRADCAALFIIDGEELRKKEQALRPDLELQEGADVVGRLSLAATRGTKAGACGLALLKGRPVRLANADAAHVHRARARSALAVPVLDAVLGTKPIGVVVFDREAPTPFGDDDEAMALQLAHELASSVATERVLVDLDDERRRTARVFGAARAFSGVVRLEDAIEQTLIAARDLAPKASVAVVMVERAAGQPPVLFVARARSGVADLPLAEGERFALDEGSWVGKAFAQRAALPHDAAHADLALHGLYARSDRRTKALGDVRVIPLASHGDVAGLLVVATPPGEKLREQKRRALDVLADIAGTAIGGAKLFFTVEQRATTDGLTGLVNRRTLDEKLNQAIARAGRSQRPLAVILCDIDHFKSVNDTYGHAAGDQVLVGVAKAIAGCARQTDVVARYGGEELCVVLEDTDADGGVRLAERMRLAIKALRFETDKGPLSVTTSFGVALLAHGDDALAVRERADAGLYRAKRGGRDRVVLDGAPAAASASASSGAQPAPSVLPR